MSLVRPLIWLSLSIAARAKQIVARATASDQLTLHEMRGKLLNDIDRYHKDAAKFIPAAGLAIATSLPPKKTVRTTRWDSLDEDDGDEEPVRPSDQEAVVAQNAEDVQIALPSNLGMEFCITHDITRLVEVERELRKGQMNDALHRLRVAIGYKSLLYRTTVRKAKSHREKLRSFDDVHLANVEVLSNAQTYTYSRTAVQKLFRNTAEDQEECGRWLARYRVLEKSDLHTNTTLIEPEVRGVSNLSLPWFWGLGADKDARTPGWLGECESTTGTCDLN